MVQKELVRFGIDEGLKDFSSKHALKVTEGSWLKEITFTNGLKKVSSMHTQHAS